MVDKCRIQNMDGREVNIERPRKNPPNSTAVQSSVNDRASSNLHSTHHTLHSPIVPIHPTAIL